MIATVGRRGSRRVVVPGQAKFRTYL